MSRKMLVVSLVLAAVLIAGASAVSAWWRHRQAWLEAQMRPFEIGPIAEIAWTEGGTPMLINCSIVDTNGRPVPGISVDFGNNSGGNSAISDRSGQLACHMGEMEVDSIRINSTEVMARPHPYVLGYPNVTNGLQVKILLKNSEALKAQIKMAE